MAAERSLYAKEERRLKRTGESVDVPFLLLVLLLLVLVLAQSSVQSVDPLPQVLVP